MGNSNINNMLHLKLTSSRCLFHLVSLCSFDFGQLMPSPSAVAGFVDVETDMLFAHHSCQFVFPMSPAHHLDRSGACL